MAFNKEYYRILRELGGYSAKEANIFARRSAKKVKEIVEHGILRRLGSGEKISKVLKYAMSRYFGFSSKDANRIKGFSKENVINTLATKVLPNVGDMVIKRVKDGIKYYSAYDANLYQHKKYMYEVEYYVDTGFVSTKKFVRVTSNEKLSKKQIYNHIVNTQFPKHEEEYESVPLPNTIRVTKAYYITADEKKKITAQRDADYSAKKNTSHNRPRKK